jgi:hypothetical protein
MNFDSKLEYVGLKEKDGKLQLTDQHLGRRWVDQGLITMSWNNPVQGATGIDVREEEVLFTMMFRATETTRLSEVLRIGSQYTRAESYEGKGELGNLSLRFVEKNGVEVVGKSELYQNYPNPFDQRTVIGINLAHEGRGTLKISDITGRSIKVIEQNWTKGYHEVWLDRREIKATGVLYYSFESFPNGAKDGKKPFRAVKKMVMVE